MLTAEDIMLRLSAPEHRRTAAEQLAEQFNRLAAERDSAKAEAAELRGVVKYLEKGAA